MNDAARTPKLSELLFEHLCAASGVVANRVSDDQNGWDLIVEFPQQPTTRPPDTNRPAVTCLVQIKSSVKTNASYRLKLSNALRFARHPLPCFIVKIEFRSDGKTPSGWHLQHFWHDQIKKTLKTAREEHSNGHDDLNKTILTFKLDESEKVASEALIGLIQTVVNSIPNYATAKSDYAEKIGYESGAGAGRFSLRGEDAVVTLVDAMTGFNDGVEVENFSFTPSRFGIPERAPLEVSTAAKLTITTKPIAVTDVILFSPDRQEQLSLPAEIYTPALPDLPKNLLRMRIHTAILDMAVAPFTDGATGMGDVKISFNFDLSYSLPQLQDTASVFGWVQKGPVEFELWYDGKLALTGQLSAAMPEYVPSWAALAYIAKSLHEFVPTSQQPKGLLFRTADFSDMKSLIQAAGIMQANAATMRFSMVGLFQEPGEIKRFVWPFFFDIGSATYFGICQYDISRFEIEEKHFTLGLDNGILLSRAVLRGSVAENADFILAEIEATEKRVSLGDPGVLFQKPDLIGAPSSGG